MPKLVDYLRVNEDDEILEIIGNCFVMSCKISAHCIFYCSYVRI